MNNYELVGFFNPFGDDIPDFVWPVFKKDSDENLYLQDELLCLENIKFTKLNESLVNKVKFLNNYNISDYNGIDNYSKLKEYNLKLDINKILNNITNKDNQYTIPIFIPHLGCNNECVFCNQRKITGIDTSVTVDDVDNIINEHLDYFKNNKNNKKIEIAFFGGSFTGIPTKLQENYLKIANNYIEEGKVDSIRLSTRPDYISPKILSLLKKYNVKTIELGVQSMSDKVLEISKRGHTKNDVIRAARLIHLYGIDLGIQIMVGLPGSNLDTEVYSIKKVLKLLLSYLKLFYIQ